MSGLWDGLVDMWGLGDYAGAGSPLKDSGPGGHDGQWSDHPGIFQESAEWLGLTGYPCSRCCTVECLKCPCNESDSKGFMSYGWNRTNGHGGGFVPYPSGVAWYDPQHFTISFWVGNILVPVGSPCPTSVATDFVQQPWGGGNYTGASMELSDPGDPLSELVPVGGDYVSYAGKIWRCRESYFSTGLVPPPDDPAHWYPWDEDPETHLWTDCYGDKIPLSYGGVIGDHAGFPAHSGWMVRQAPVRFDSFLQTLDPVRFENKPMSINLALFFEAESSGAHPPILALIPGGFGRSCQLMTIRVDDPFIDFFMNGAFTGRISSVGMATSNTGIGFNWVDRNQALSGSYEVGQSAIDDVMLWDRPLDNDEILELWGGLWCRHQFSLQTTHRAEPGSAASADHSTTTPRHLSGVRFRAEPQPGSSASPAAAGDLSQPAHFSNVRFRAGTAEE